ncbi:MAG: hypothetical protein ACR2G0_02720 [Chthoniobacterales bacterium]
MTSSDVNPLQLLDSSNDGQPAPQRISLTNALTSQGGTSANLDSRNLSGLQGRSFQYWRTTNPDTGMTVSQEVINFLNAHIPAH